MNRLFLRVICLALCATMLFSAPAIAEISPYAVPFNNGDYTKYGLIAPNGKILIEPSYMGIARLQLPMDDSVYFDLCVYDEELKQPMHALVDDALNRMTPFEFMEVNPGYSAFIYGVTVSRYDEGSDTYFDGQYGVLSATGVKLTEPIYTQIVATSDGGFLALKTSTFDDQSDAVYHILPDGTESLTDALVLSLPYVFSGGMGSAMGDGQLYGYLGEGGEWVISPRYGVSNAFSGEYASASEPGSELYGLINRYGEYVMVPQFDTINTGDESGNDASPSSYILTSQYDLKRVALIDAGTLSTIAVFDGAYVYRLTDQLFVVTNQDGVATLINRAGETVYVADGKYAYFTNLGADRVLVSSDLSTFIISTSGARLSTDLGTTVYLLSEFSGQPCALAVGAPTSKYGLYTLDGVELLPAEYDFIQTLDKDIFYARKGRTQGIINRNSDWLYAEYDYAKLMD